MADSFPSNPIVNQESKSEVAVAFHLQQQPSYMLEEKVFLKKKLLFDWRMDIIWFGSPFYYQEKKCNLLFIGSHKQKS